MKENITRREYLKECLIAVGFSEKQAEQCVSDTKEGCLEFQSCDYCQFNGYKNCCQEQRKFLDSEMPTEKIIQTKVYYKINDMLYCGNCGRELDENVFKEVKEKDKQKGI